MDYPASFRLWLHSRGYSPSTVKNYLADVNHYLQSYATPPSTTQLFAPSSLKAYLLPFSTDSNLPRYLASLSQFCQFALDQKIITVNPLATAKKQLQRPAQIPLDNLLKDYQNYLLAHHHTPATIKNYLADVKRYLSWAPADA